MSGWRKRQIADKMEQDMNKTIDFFHTPESMDEMQDILDRLAPTERALVYPYVMMMYNLMVSKLGAPVEA